MKILKIIVENFLSYKKLNFEFDKGLYLIYGENGSGKSSIGEALFWGLFGSLLREGKIDDVVNNKKLKDCCVTVVIEKNRDKYYIKRYRKHFKFKNDLFLYKNDKDIRGENIKVTQEKIESLIGTNSLIFSIVNLFSVDTLRFISASDGDKKKILDIMFPDMSYIRPKILDFQNDIKEKIKNLEEQNYKLNIKIKLLKENKLNLNKPDIIKISKIQKLKEKYNKYKKYVDENKEKNERIIKVLENQDDLCNENNSLILESDKIVSNIAKFNFRMTEVLKNKLCFTCKQKIKDKKAEELIKECISKVDNNNFRFKEIEKEINSINSKLITENIKQQYESVIKKYEGYRDKVEKYYEYKYKLDALLDDEKVYNNNYKKYTINIEQYELKIKIVNNEIIKAYKNLAHYNFLSKALLTQGNKPIPIKSFLYELVLPMLEKEANKILLKFDPDMKIKITMENRERIVVNVSKYDGAGKFKLASGGEKRRADLAISLAIRRLLLTESNILILDDIFDVVDDEGIENILNVLSSFIKNTAIYCISPKENEISFFENVIEIKKINGFSKLRKV